MKRILLPFLSCLLLAACTEITGPDGELGKLDTNTPESVDISSDEQTFDIYVTHPTSPKKIDANIMIDDGDNWIKLDKVVKIEKGRQYTFSFEQNLTGAARKATINFTSKSTSNSIRIRVTQHPQVTCDLDNDTYEVRGEGGELKIPVYSNVDFKVVVAPYREGGNAVYWLKHKGTDEYDNMFFTVEKNKTGKVREALVKLLYQVAPQYPETELASIVVLQGPSYDSGEGGEGEGDGGQGGEGEGGQEGDGDQGGNVDVTAEVLPDPTSATFIDYAVQMSQARLYPNWYTDRVYPSGGANITFPIKNSEGSAEVLIYPSGFEYGIETVMGIEGNLLLRFGNTMSSSAPDIDKLYLVTGDQSWMEVDHKFETGKWYHIALTWKNGVVKVYVNAKECLSVSGVGVDVERKWSYEEDGKERCWWWGYSYESARSFRGRMAEFRLWKTAITPEILHEKDHYCNLNVNKYKDQIYGYWKVTSGTDPFLKNTAVNSAYSQHSLWGEIYVNVVNDIHKGEPGVNRVALD